MSLRNISIPAVALAGAGAVVVYAATKGAGLASGFRALAGGQPVPAGEDLTVIDAGGDGQDLVDSGLGTAPANNAVAAAGVAYQDKAIYRWGGANPARGWDCSGFVNWVLNHDLGMAIPGYRGGTFTGTAHGPVTSQWAIWSGCTGIGRGEVGAGDLVVWPLGHMGIAIDNQRMINCPGPNGTPAPVIGHIDAVHRGPLVCRRLKGQR